MIEKVIKDHLAMHISVPVFLERQDPSPASYVLLEKTGSSKTNHLPRSTFAFQSYARSMYEAARLNEQVKNAVETLINLKEIGSVTLNSDYNFTDTDTKTYRYQAVYDIYHY